MDNAFSKRLAPLPGCWPFAFPLRGPLFAQRCVSIKIAWVRCALSHLPTMIELRYLDNFSVSRKITEFSYFPGRNQCPLVLSGLKLIGLLMWFAHAGSLLDRSSGLNY